MKVIINFNLGRIRYQVILIKEKLCPTDSRGAFLALEGFHTNVGCVRVFVAVEHNIATVRE